VINLLPPDAKAEMRAGIFNTMLRRLVVLFVTVILLMTAVFAGGLYITLHVKQIAETEKQQELDAAAKYTKTKVAADAFASNLAAAKTILSNQISYTSLVIELTNALPKGTSLTALNLDSTSFGKPFTMSAEAVSYDAALQLKTALANKMITPLPGKPPVHLMTNVNIMDLNSKDAPDSNGYTLTLTLSGVLTTHPPIINEQGQSK